MTASKNLIQAAAGSAGGGDFYDYVIENSALFENGHYLYRTPSAGNRKTYTISFWIKRTKVSADVPVIFSAVETSGVSEWYSSFDSSDLLRLYSGGANYGVRTDAQYRDVSSWMHVVFRVDTTQATASNRCRVYVNGVDVSGTAYSQPAQNTDTAWNKNSGHIIGWFYSISGAAYHGWYYLADFIHVEGQSLDPTSFGQSKNGTWIPKEYTGSYGTNGFHLNFANSSNYGNDVSGNGNHFTQSGMGTQDTRIDTPTNNFPVFNNLMNWGPQYLQQGNLQAYNSTSAYWMPYQVTMAVPDTGKWYAEFKWISGSYAMVGVSNYLPESGTNGWAIASTYWYYHVGRMYVNGSQLDGYASYNTSDILSITIDRDNDEIIFRKNNSVIYTGTSVNRNVRFFSVNTLAGTQGINLGQNPTYGGQYAPSSSNSDANGYGSFVYAPPTGALALCAANLPDPDIGPTKATQADDHFNTVLYTGNGSSQNVTGFGFSPGMVWHKGRSVAYSHSIVDVIRGNSNVMFTNATDAEQNPGAQLDLITNGATVTYRSANLANNQSGATYVIWGWKSGGSGVSNTNGSITSTVSANTRAGFSIVTYTGSSSGISVGHGLSSAPEMIIWKARGTPNGSARSWIVWTKDLTSTDYIVYLNLTNAETNVTAGSVLSSSPTSTTFSLGTEPSVNWNAENYVAYCFHSVEGFSSFGKYTGNGSTNGPFVYTGFRPAWVMIKKTNAAGQYWPIHDNKRPGYNLTPYPIYANYEGAEDTSHATARGLDFLSNGIKVRATTNDFNTSGGTYIYMAFAENPFKYSNAR